MARRLPPLNGLKAFEQQRKFQKVCGLRDAVASATSFGCTPGKAAPNRAAPCAARANSRRLSDRDINILASEIDVVRRCRNTQVDVWMFLGKAA